jgi:hypothetical protein
MNQEIHHKNQITYTQITKNPDQGVSWPRTQPAGGGCQAREPAARRARWRHMAVSRLRREGRTREGCWREGTDAELASADAREGRRP